jgi:hypothetical protein
MCDVPDARTGSNPQRLASSRLLDRLLDGFAGLVDHPNRPEGLTATSLLGGLADQPLSPLDEILVAADGRQVLGDGVALAEGFEGPHVSKIRRHMACSLLDLRVR